jgi:outer membrane protein OmpA-like peptidoglycan-associated protein
MKPTNRHLAALAVAAAALALPTLCPSCTKAEPSAPASAQGRAISAKVTAAPKTVEVTFDGKKIGQTPTSVKASSFDQLINSFSAADPSKSTVEQRISVISEDQVEVDLVFAAEMSKMAKALSLSKIIVFDYGERVTFDVNSSEIKPVFRPLLEKQAEMLKKYFSGVDVYVCGHTDATGSRDRNAELSLERAKSVHDQLLAMGIPKSSMRVQGFASDYPISDNKTSDGRARNRRIEIILGR